MRSMNEVSGKSLQYSSDSRSVGYRSSGVGHDFVLNLTELGGMLRRGLWIIALCTLVGGLISTYVVLKMTPTYSATSQILLGQQRRADDALTSIFQQLDLDTNQIAGEVAIMESGPILRRVSERLQLSRLPEFNFDLRPYEEPSLLESGIEALKEGLKTLLGAGEDDEELLSEFAYGEAGEGGTVDPITVAASAEAANLGDEADFVGAVAAGLRIRQVGKTPLVDISFLSEDPVVAAAVANAMADEYIAYQLEEKFGATQRMTAGLNDRISALRLRLEAAERAVIEFRDQMLEGGGGGGSEWIEQQIRELSSRLVEVGAEYSELQAKLSQVDTLIAEQGALSVVGVLDSELLRQLQQDRSDLLLRQDQMRERFGADSPRLDEAAVNVSRLESAIGQEVARLRDELASQTSVAAAREQSIEQQLRDLERRYLTLSQEQVRLGQLQREADASRLVYESFLTTFTQTNEVAGLQEADARVVSYANPPSSPSSPNKKVSVLLGLIAGFFAGMALVFLRAFRDQSIDSVDKLRRMLGAVPVVATIPRIRGVFHRGSPIEHLGEETNRPLEEAARTLRNTLMVKRTAPGWKVAVISAMPAEGKTTTSLLLAHTAVKAGKSCVVVETDLRRGSIARVLGLAPTPDLVDLLDGNAELHEAMRRDPKTGAYVLCAQPGVADPAGLLLSERMQDLIKTLEKHFDLIVFDTTPLLSVTDALPVLRYSDDVVMAVRWRRSSAESMRSVLTTLREAGVSLTCAVMTMTRGREFRKYEDYYYTKESTSP